ncbi:MAG: hypothetical protein AABX13_05815 [Nanoarchaeota archaeon]
MTLDSFIPGPNVYSKPLTEGELQLHRVAQGDGFTMGKETYLLWLVDKGKLTITAFCRQYADKITPEEYHSIIKEIQSPEDFQRLAGEYEQRLSDA